MQSTIQIIIRSSIPVSLIAAAGWAEYQACLIMASGDLSHLMAWHSAGCLLAAPGMALLFGWGETKSVAFATVLAFGWCLPLPVLGPATALLLFAVYRLVRVRSKLKHFITGVELPVLRQSAPQGKGVSGGGVAGNMKTSIMQMLNRPDTSSRRAAIFSARKLQPRQALPILMKALGDHDEHIRIFAQGLIQKIVTEIERNMKKMEEALHRDDDDPRQLASLAEQYHELVYLGLIEPESRPACLDKAIDLASRAVVLEPNNTSLKLALLKYALRRGSLDVAGYMLADLEAARCPSNQLLPWRMEYLYEKRDWDALKELTTDATQRAIPGALRQSLAFWLLPGRHQEAA